MLLGCAVGLLSACGTVSADTVEQLTTLAGLSVNLLVYSSKVPLTLLAGEPSIGYNQIIPGSGEITFVLGDSISPVTPVPGVPPHVKTPASFTIDYNGHISLSFPAGATTPVFDGDELFFTTGDLDSPVFGSDVFDYIPTTSALAGTLKATSVINGVTFSKGTQCDTIVHTAGVLTAPTLVVTAGVVVINIFSTSFTPLCGVTYGWSSIASDTVPGGTSGDPQFTGFVGQSYQVHGVSGSVYNVISTPSFQLNALFNYLESGKCRSGTMCFSHPGNYFGEIGMLLKDQAGSVSQLRVVAGPVETGMTVWLNDEALTNSVDAVKVGDSSLVFGDAFELTIASPEFSLRLTNSDMFLNEDISVNTPLVEKIQAFKHASKRNDTSELDFLPHGLLGQTWQYKTFPNRWKYIQGQLFDYVVSDGLFGSIFNFNRFTQ